MLVLVALFSMVTFAQNENITWNAKFGMNMSNFTGDMETDMRVGFNLGVGMEYHFTDMWSLAPSIMFTQKGARYEKEIGYNDVKVKTKFNPLYLEIPIQALARFNVMEDQNVVVKAGPYFGIGLAGKAKYGLSGDLEGYSESELLDMAGIEDEKLFSSDGWDAKRFDCGLAIGVAYEIQKFFVAVDGEFGFVKMFDGDDAPKNLNFSIGVGYNF